MKSIKVTDVTWRRLKMAAAEQGRPLQAVVEAILGDWQLRMTVVTGPTHLSGEPTAPPLDLMPSAPNIKAV